MKDSTYSVVHMAFTREELQVGLHGFIQAEVQYEELKKTRNREIALQIASDIFKRINIHEPRFGSCFKEENNNASGLQILNANHIEIRVYLDQIDLFNLEENGAPEGATFLDIKDERSKAFCIWSEFLTAAGHLSARKIRERFMVCS